MRKSKKEVIVLGMILGLVFCISVLGVSFKLLMDRNAKQPEVPDTDTTQVVSTEIDSGIAVNADPVGSYHVQTIPEYQPVFSEQDFVDHCTRMTGNDNRAQLVYPLDAVEIIREDRLTILQLEAYAANNDTTVQIAVGDDVHDLQLKTKPTLYRILLTQNGTSIKIQEENGSSDLHINAVNLRLYENTKRVLGTLGTYTSDVYEEVTLSPSERIMENSANLLFDGAYLYNINRGILEVYTKEYKLVGRRSGLGYTRDMAFTKDKRAIVVTSRRNGAYIVDISIPEKPEILSHYDTLEYATGLAVNGDYAFICSRFFGVEIVDISDLQQPRHVSVLNSTVEYQDCYFADGYLYVGCFLGSRIDIWDVRDAAQPKRVSTIRLDGNGQGCRVANGLLFAATGLNSSPSLPLTDPATGAGNGLEIYDVSDPSAPVKLSTTKVDGKMNCNVRDIFDVELDGSTAYLSDLRNGLLVYDVSDPAAPVLLYRVNIVANASDPSFTYPDGNYIFPYNAEKQAHASVSHAVMGGDRVYIVTADMGVYTYSAQTGSAVQVDAVYPLERSEQTEQDLPQLDGYTTELYRNDGQIYAVARCGANYIIANGKNGILVLDDSFREVCSRNTRYVVRDVKVFGDIIFTAESQGGLAAYRYQDGRLVQLGRYSESKYDSCYGNLALTSDGAYAVIEVALYRWCLVDVRTPERMKEIDPESFGVSQLVGNIYYRNTSSGLVDGKYVVLSTPTKTLWVSSENGELQIIEQQSWPKVTERNNGTATEDGYIFVSEGGYYYRSVTDDAFGEMIKLDGLYLRGKCSAYGDTLVLASCEGRISLIDISDVRNPTLLTSCDYNGNADVAYIDAEQLLVPSRYYGLLIFRKTAG